MLELLLCSLLTILPDYLYRRYVQGKRIGKEITLYSVWFELRWGITACVILTVSSDYDGLLQPSGHDQRHALLPNGPDHPRNERPRSPRSMSTDGPVARERRSSGWTARSRRPRSRPLERKIAEVDAAWWRGDIVSRRPRARFARPRVLTSRRWTSWRPNRS